MERHAGFSVRHLGSGASDEQPRIVPPVSAVIPAAVLFCGSVLCKWDGAVAQGPVA